MKSSLKLVVIFKLFEGVVIFELFDRPSTWSSLNLLSSSNSSKAWSSLNCSTTFYLVVIELAFIFELFEGVVVIELAFVFELFEGIVVIELAFVFKLFDSTYTSISSFPQTRNLSSLLHAFWHCQLLRCQLSYHTDVPCPSTELSQNYVNINTDGQHQHHQLT